MPPHDLPPLSLSYPQPSTFFPDPFATATPLTTSWPAIFAPVFARILYSVSSTGYTFFPEALLDTFFLFPYLLGELILFEIIKVVIGVILHGDSYSWSHVPVDLGWLWVGWLLI